MMALGLQRYFLGSYQNERKFEPLAHHAVPFFMGTRRVSQERFAEDEVQNLLALGDMCGGVSPSKRHLPEGPKSA